MLNRRHRLAVTARALAIAGVIPSGLHAQDSTQVDSTRADSIPVRELGPIEARSAHGLSGVNAIRAISDGSVLVLDRGRRQLLRFDASLKNATPIADTANAPLPWGTRNNGLLPYLGDSSIFVDPATLAFVVIGPSGNVARVMAPPRVADVNLLATSNAGTHAFDAKGRLYYRINQGGGGGGGGGGRDFQGMRGGGGGGGDRGGRGGGGGGDFRGGGGGDRGPGGGRGGFNPQNQPDSLPIVRADFDTRKTDTVAWVKVPRTDFQMTSMPDGSMRMTARLNPLPQGDDWTLLADGTVAVIRVLDYHVDFYHPDGTQSSSPKLPFDWKRITDEDKVRMIDSLKTITSQATERIAQAQAQGGGGFRTAFEPVDPQRLPDYYPPIRPGTSHADFDGNVWLLPATSSLAAQLSMQMQGGRMPGMGPGMAGRGSGGGGAPPGGGRGGRGAQQQQQQQQRAAQPDSAARPDSLINAALAQTQYVYDVVNQRGELAYRVKLPRGRQLVGFGPNGTVFMLIREGREVFIERARIQGL